MKDKRKMKYSLYHLAKKLFYQLDGAGLSYQKNIWIAGSQEGLLNLLIYNVMNLGAQSTAFVKDRDVYISQWNSKNRINSVNGLLNLKDKVFRQSIS